MYFVSRFSAIFSRSTRSTMATSRTFPVGVLNAPIARPNNAIVMRSSFWTIPQVSNVVIVLWKMIYIVTAVNFNSQY